MHSGFARLTQLPNLNTYLEFVGTRKEQSSRGSTRFAVGTARHPLWFQIVVRHFSRNLGQGLDIDSVFKATHPQIASICIQETGEMDMKQVAIASDLLALSSL